MPKIKYPKGFVMGSNTQIAVRFPSDFFKDIIAQARREKKDFNAMVVDLCLCGKLCMDESDRYEPGTEGQDRESYSDTQDRDSYNPER